MKYLIYIIFILLSFGQLQRISFFDQQVNVYLHEAVMVLFIVGGIGLIREIKKVGKLGRTFIIFLGILFLSLINNFWKFSFFENLVGFSYWIRLVLYFIFFVILISWGNKGNWGKIRIGLNIFVILTILFSFLQYFLYPNLRNLYYLGWDPHQYRIFGAFFDTTVLGIIFVLIFYYTLSNNNFGRSVYIKYFLLSLSFVLILLTYSRITYLSFLLSFVFYFYSKIKLNSIILFLLAFLLVLFILPRPAGESVKLERIFTIEARADDIKHGFNLFKKNPLLGVGFNRIRFFKGTEVDSHAASSFSSSYVTLLASSGIIGLIGGIWAIWILWGLVDRIEKTLIIVIATSSFFDNIFLNNFILLFFVVLLSYFSLLSHKKQSNPSK